MKQTIVVWANCQCGPIKHMLHKYYDDKFDINHFLNYEYITPFFISNAYKTILNIT